MNIINSLLDFIEVDEIVESLLTLLIPKGDKKAISIAADVLDAGVTLLTELLGDDKLTAEYITDSVRDFLDSALDEIPGWKKLSEVQRDLLLDAVVTIVKLIAAEISPRSKKNRKKRKWGRGKKEAPITMTGPRFIRTGRALRVPNIAVAEKLALIASKPGHAVAPKQD